MLNNGRETDTYRYQLPQSVRGQGKAIDAALADINACDLAIGSGAFPVGLLHEIVNARLALAPHSGNHQSAYELKRHAIAESLYGVDIDASAIDIARLRLWLSLIVDEEDYATIAALPNLDYKIVRGDSLVGFPENWNGPAFAKIEQLQKRYFPETDHDKKAVLKQQIDAEIQQRLDGSNRSSAGRLILISDCFSRMSGTSKVGLMWSSAIRPMCRSRNSADSRSRKTGRNRNTKLLPKPVISTACFMKRATGYCVIGVY